MTLRTLLAATAACLIGTAPVHAVTIDLSVVASYARPSAFGLAFDGTNIWYSNNAGTIFEMTTSGVNTGNSITGNYWSALAYNDSSSRLVTMQNTSIRSFDRSSAPNVNINTLNPVTTAIAGGRGGLIDGLDIQGGTLWWSPDVDVVYTSPVNGSGSRSTFLGGAGGYSGVEYVSAGGNDYVIVVNDAFSPRQLCVHATDASQIGCTTLPNSRYEDLAFDGRYLYAADYFGSRIDKIDLLVDGGSIFDPGGGGGGGGGGTNVPEPATMMLLGTALAGLSLTRRRKPG